MCFLCAWFQSFIHNRYKKGDAKKLNRVFSHPHFSDVFCYNFIGCALKIFRFLNDSRYLSWSLVAYESLVIYESLVEHRTFVLLGSFVLLDSFVLYNFLSYLRFLKCFLRFSFVDVFILPYLSLFVIWQSEHIFDCIFIYFLFYQYIISILERKIYVNQLEKGFAIHTTFKINFSLRSVSP